MKCWDFSDLEQALGNALTQVDLQSQPQMVGLVDLQEAAGLSFLVVNLTKAPCFVASKQGLQGSLLHELKPFGKTCFRPEALACLMRPKLYIHVKHQERLLLGRVVPSVWNPILAFLPFHDRKRVCRFQVLP